MTQGPKIHPRILIEAMIIYWLVRRCSKREHVVADRLPQGKPVVPAKLDIGQTVCRLPIPSFLSPSLDT